MKDQVILENTLIQLKHMKALLNTFAQEASNEQVLKVVEKAYKDISTYQRSTYDLMLSLNFMKVTSQTQSGIKKVYDKYKTKEC